LQTIEYIEDLEAAIGIEPMNKGFAVLVGLFFKVLGCALTFVLICPFNTWTVRMFTWIWASVA
jgi:hypothetical protein